MSKRVQQKLQRREQIIQAAKELFLDQGVQSVQMQDIANAADVGIATLFRYFPKKEHLVIATSNVITDQMATDVQTIVGQSGTAYEKIDQILDYYMNMIQDPQLRLAKFFDSFNLYEKIKEESPDQYEDYIQARSKLAKALLVLAEQGQRDFSIKADVDVALFMITMVQNFSIYTFKSSLATHDSDLAPLLSVNKQLLLMKDVFLQYIRPH